MRRTPFDEDRALQLGKQAEHRPGRDLRLGDEGARDERAQQGDVEVRAVVGDEQGRPVPGLRTAADDVEPDDAAAGAMIELGDALGESQPEGDGEGLGR